MNPTHLLIGKAPAHRAAVVGPAAANQGIILHMVPAGVTALFQPLDYRVLGIAMKKLQKRYYEKMAKNGETFTLDDLTVEFETILRSLPRSQIINAWSPFGIECPVEDADEGSEFEGDAQSIHHTTSD